MPEPTPWPESVREYGRGFAGGLLFSLPLLYTMEVWWAGYVARPPRLLALLAATFLLLLAYNRVSGMRHDASWIEVAIDSVEELGLGTLTAVLVLFLIGRIGPDVSRGEALGLVVAEAVVVAIGFSVGTAQLGPGASDRELGAEGDRAWSPLARHVVIAACGALLFAANVAPTEEVVVIALDTGPLRLLGLVLLSLLIVGAILVLTRRAGEDELPGGKSGLLYDTALTYVVGLAIAAAVLWFFGRFDGASPVVALRQSVVLAFPSGIGAAAGKVLLEIREDR